MTMPSISAVISRLPSNVWLDLDLGYVGIKDDYPKLNSVLLIKKKNPGAPLCP